LSHTNGRTRNRAEKKPSCTQNAIDFGGETHRFECSAEDEAAASAKTLTTHDLG